jgi:hypothetical protein
VFTPAAALCCAWVVLSLVWLTVVDPRDVVAAFIAFQILIPSLCIVPLLTMATQNPFAGVVLSGFLLGSMKGLAGVVVNLVYGWGDGHHEMPWTDPNLMLTTFWVAAGILCFTCHLLGARKFRLRYVSENATGARSHTC